MGRCFTRLTVHGPHSYVRSGARLFIVDWLKRYPEVDVANPGLDLDRVKPLIRAALREDIGNKDITTHLTIGVRERGLGVIVAKGEGVCAGLPVAMLVFRLVDPRISAEVQVSDGTPVSFGDVVGQVQGPARGILSGERVALNFLQHLSGIATLTSRYVAAVKGTTARILDTRKTTPGLRALEKYAVRIGGGENHRSGLFDLVLIKDNHIQAAGSVRRAVEEVRRGTPGDVFIEVEVTNRVEVEAALQCGVDRMMLDNMDLPAIGATVDYVRSHLAPGQRRPQIEVSGGVTLSSVRAIAEAGVDFISVGALTHSAPALDLSLRYKRIG